MQRHNSEAQEARQKEQKEKRAILYNAYKECFSTPHGRLVLDDILSKGMLWQTTFTGNSQTYFNEGKRDLALYVLKRTNTADPNIIIKMMEQSLELKLNKGE